MSEKFDELQNDEFETELEDEKNKNRLPLLLLLIVAIAALGFFLYTLSESAKARNTNNTEDIPSTSVVKKEFKKELPPLTKPVPVKEELLPLLPTKIIKEKTYKPRIIKSRGQTILKFNTNIKELNNISSKESYKDRKKILDKKDRPFTGGISSVAGINKYNPNLYLARGTYIGCSLKTKLVSAVSGQIACTVTSDIYSVSGNVLLVDKGSTIVGKYKSGNLKFGLDRHYVIWDEIRTPNNVMINVSSGATDELGAGGIHGEVDYNWGIRIGSALLVSLIDDALSAAASNISKNGQTNYLVATGENSQSMSERVLDKFINIPSVLYKNHGDVVGVYVNKDIDFSKVYKLKRKGR